MSEAQQDQDNPASNADKFTDRIVFSASKIIKVLAAQDFNENIDTRALPQAMQTTAPNTSIFLPSSPKQAFEVLSSIDELLYSTNESSDDEDTCILPQLDERSHLALVSQSVYAYLSQLERSRLVKVSSKVANETSKWISNIFRFLDSMASYHSNSAESLAQALRLALTSKFPNYLEQGVQDLPKLSVYISENENSALLDLQYAVRIVGLPQSCIKVIPCNTVFGSPESIDASALQNQITSDVTVNIVPVFLIADLGTSFCGNVDNLVRLQDICHKHNIWIHCRGPALTALAVSQGSSDVKKIDSSKIISSMTLDLESWLGLPSIQTVLLYKQLPNFQNGIFDSDSNISRLSALSLWTSLQCIGKDAITNQFLQAFESCRILYEIVTRMKGFRLLSKKPGGETGSTVSELANQPINIAMLFEAAVSSLVFQFGGSVNEPKANDADVLTETGNTVDPIVKKTIEKINNSSYYDRLNSWLGQTLQRDFPQVPLALVDHTIYGTCIRYCPFELGVGENVPTTEILAQFAEFFEMQVDILNATVEKKAVFVELVEKSPVLRLVELADDWAGLGGVHFVPEDWENFLTDQAKTELNKLNTQLVETLRTADNAFSLGEGAEGSLICVRFGMVTSDTDIVELLDLVIHAGRSIQENSKVLDSMTEIVKKGIESATIDLQRETEEKLWQDGILRAVPVVGTFVNWWSPLTKENTKSVKGRSLNLVQGVVESTENIYKNHLISNGINNPHLKSETPTENASHSRNVSQSSSLREEDISGNQAPPATPVTPQPQPPMA